VGYHPENLPFSFINDKEDLVGFDVELMSLLARELDVELEFVEWPYETLFTDLNSHKFDVAVGGLIANPNRLAKARFSNSYMKLTTAVVVEDHNRYQFDSWPKIDRVPGMRLGGVGEERAGYVQRELPDTDVVRLENYSAFFGANKNKADALVISAEAGSAWTILYPAYSVVVPEPHHKAYAALAIPLDDPAFEHFINDWLEVKQTSGAIDWLYRKWVLGKETQRRQVRWSLGRDVFGLWE
jgi:ABC-type amino acid transport substrate-binding protein